MAESMVYPSTQSMMKERNIPGRLEDMEIVVMLEQEVKLIW